MIKATKSNSKGVDKVRRESVNKKDVYARYIDWIALTNEERKKIGLPTQKSFCEKYGINTTTVCLWQDRPEFSELKRKAQVKKLSLETSDVLEGLKNRCVKYGMAYDIELFLLYVEDWNREHILKLKGEVKLGADDLRSIIDLLPVPKRAKFYDVLTELIAEAEGLRSVEQA
jgi:hypothetical protein